MKNMYKFLMFMAMLTISGSAFTQNIVKAIINNTKRIGFPSSPFKLICVDNIIINIIATLKNISEMRVLRCYVKHSDQ